jgi:peptidoglycan-N-acetylmuramic acid deacetylase
MKRYFIRTVLAMIVFLTAISTGANTVFADNGRYSWYCVHRKDHLQPEAAEEFRFCADLDGYYVDTHHGDDNPEKVIYLTFDAGYENGNIEKILDVMAEENVKGAFFILGNLLEKNADLVLRMFKDGHLVCNHTYSHRSMTGISREEFNAELKRLETACINTVGYSLDRFYRPPEGKFDRDSLQYAKDLGYKTVFWSFAYEDWDNNKQLSADKAKKKILDNVHNGEIMLLHPTSATNAEILRDVITELKKEGYRFGSLDDL